MRHEVRPAFRGAPELPGDLYELALRVDGAGGIMAMTSTDSSRLTGFHHPNGVFVVITEAQGVEPHTWEAALANTVGDEDRVLAVGNPLQPGSKFHDVCQSKGWRTFKISAFDHPNLKQGQEVIPGAVTRRFVESVRNDYGEGSSIYRARVLGEFPTDAEDALVERDWLDAAAERWEEAVASGDRDGLSYRIALDPARFGPDETVLAITRGEVLVEFRVWSRRDTMETTGRVREIIVQLETPAPPRNEREAVRHYFEPSEPPRVSRVIVDEVGLGGGVVDRLKELKTGGVKAFNGARAASRDGRERFANLRAEAFWHIRYLLERRLIALPRDEKLWEELTTIRWAINSAGRIQIEAKDLTRSILGRSPGRADAASMAFYDWKRPRTRRVEAWFPGMVETPQRR